MATKEEAQYRDDKQSNSPNNCCGYCTMYDGTTRGCTVVDGDISPYALCKKYYKPHRNPNRGLWSIVRKVTATTSDNWAK